MLYLQLEFIQTSEQHLPGVLSICEQQNQRHETVQIAVIVPRGFVEQKDVPVTQHKHEARRLEFIPQSDSQGACESEKRHVNDFILKSFFLQSFPKNNLSR